MSTTTKISKCQTASQKGKLRKKDTTYLVAFWKYHLRKSRVHALGGSTRAHALPSSLLLGLHARKHYPLIRVGGTAALAAMLSWALRSARALWFYSGGARVKGLRYAHDDVSTLLY